MGFLDFLNKKSIAKPNNVESDELRQEIFESIDRNNMVEFEILCQENEAHIIKAFPEWKKAPESVRADKEQMKKYAYCLMVIASYFQKQRNRGELMTMLTGIDDSEYSRKWQDSLGQCRALMQQFKFDEALPMLEQCLELASGVSGAGVDKFLPLTLGFLGECYFHCANTEKASEYINKALECTTMQGDTEASLAYMSNLYEVNRYAGDSAKAAEIAEAIASKEYDRGELVLASNWRHQARAVAAGEPLHRMTLRVGDEFFEMNEIPVVSGEPVEFIYVRNRIELVRCSAKCHEARQLAQNGKFDECLAALEEAKAFDKYSGQPYYLSAAIKLAGRYYIKAVEDFQKVEELCPGYETSRSDLWLAQQLHENKMAHDATLVVFEATNEATPIDERIKKCEEMIAKYPNYGEAYFQLGKLLISHKRSDKALEAFEKGIEVAEDEDVKSRLLRDAVIIMDNMDTKRKYLELAITLPKGNILAQAMCHYLLRQLDDYETSA
jgi:tetratricopeptide (TPR) repeat protein